MVSEPKGNRPIKILLLTNWLVKSNSNSGDWMDAVSGFLAPLHLEMDGSVWTGV